MPGSLLAIVPHDDGNWYFDNWGEPFLYALIGFLVVVAGICILIFIIWLLGLLMRKTNNLASWQFWKHRKNLEKPDSSKEYENEVRQALNGEEVAEEEEDGITPEERAAVIAAVMACLEEEGKCEFTVKRIKRIRGR